MNALSFLGFGKKAEKKSLGSLGTRKSLRMEPLEERQMLSINYLSASVADTMFDAAHDAADANYGYDIGTRGDYDAIVHFNLKSDESGTFATHLTDMLQYDAANPFNPSIKVGDNVLVIVDGVGSTNPSNNPTAGINNWGSNITIVNVGSSDFELVGVTGGGQAVMTIVDSPEVTLIGFAITQGISGGTDPGMAIVGSDVTLVGCNIHDNDAWEGGGIRAWNSDVELIACSVVDNTAVGEGGGIYAFNSRITLTDTLVAGNDATEGGGLYICSDGNNTNTASLTITGSTFSDNHALLGVGGAVWAEDKSATLDGYIDVTIRDSVFEDNHADVAGGALVLSHVPTATVTGTTFVDNTAGVYGGAIHLYSYADDTNTTYLADLVLTGNEAGQDGGAIYIEGSANVDIYNSLIADNDAVSGGGVFAFLNQGYSGTETPSLSLTNVTVADNRATDGGVVYHGTAATDLYLYNSIFYDNGQDVYAIAGAAVTSQNSLFSTNGIGLGTYVNNGGNLNTAGTSTTAADIFVDSANGNYLLKKGSLAVGAGDTAILDAMGLTTPYGKDLAGEDRLNEFGTLDMGAFTYGVEPAKFVIVNGWWDHPGPYFSDESMAITVTLENVGESWVKFGGKNWTLEYQVFFADGTSASISGTIDVNAYDSDSRFTLITKPTLNFADTLDLSGHAPGDYYIEYYLYDATPIVPGSEVSYAKYSVGQYCYSVIATPQFTLTGGSVTEGLTGAGAVTTFTITRDANDTKFGPTENTYVDLNFYDKDRNPATLEQMGILYSGLIPNADGTYTVTIVAGQNDATFTLSYDQDNMITGNWDFYVAGELSSNFTAGSATKVEQRYERQWFGGFTVIDTTTAADIQITNLTYGAGPYGNWRFYEDGKLAGIQITVNNFGTEELVGAAAQGWTVEFVFTDYDTNAEFTKSFPVNSTFFAGFVDTNGQMTFADIEFDTFLGVGTYYVTAQLKQSGVLVDDFTFCVDKTDAANPLNQYNVEIVRQPEIWFTSTETVIVEGGLATLFTLERDALPDGTYPQLWARVDWDQSYMLQDDGSGTLVTIPSGADAGTWLVFNGPTASFYAAKDHDWTVVVDEYDTITVNVAPKPTSYNDGTFLSNDLLRYGSASIDVTIKDVTAGLLAIDQIVVTIDGTVHVDGELTLLEALQLAGYRQQYYPTQFTSQDIYFKYDVTTCPYSTVYGNVADGVTIRGNSSGTWNGTDWDIDYIPGRSITVDNISHNADIFTVAAGSTVAFVGLNIGGPTSWDAAGKVGVHNEGNLTMEQCEVFSNVIGVANYGDLNVVNSLFRDNSYGIINYQDGTVDAVNVTAADNYRSFWNQATKVEVVDISVVFGAATGGIVDGQWIGAYVFIDGNRVDFYEQVQDGKFHLTVPNADAFVINNTIAAGVNEGGFRANYSIFADQPTWNGSNVFLVGNTYKTNTDPVFKPGTYEINPFASPAYNTGSNALYTGGDYDLAGNKRIKGSTIDMGCYEAEGSIIVTTALDELHLLSVANAIVSGTLVPGQDISLRDALMISEFCVGGLTITFEPTLAGSTIVLAAVDHFTTAAAAGEFLIRNDVVIDAEGMNITIDAHGASRIFNVINASTVEIIGLTLVNGKAHVGGAVNIVDGNLTLKDVVFKSNTATSWGGGLYMSGPSVVTIENGTFEENTAAFGGGLFQNGGTLATDDTLFSGNKAASYGGGLYLTGIPSATTITNSVFDGNSAKTYGAGIFMDNGNLTVENAEFMGNTAATGGGLYQRGGKSNVSVALFENNTVAGHGGGIYLTGNSTLSLSDATVRGNSADYGAGIFQSGGTLNMADTVVTGNAAATYGGGFYMTGATTAATMIGGKLAGNTAVRGAGVYQDAGSLSILGTQFNGNGNASTTHGGGIALFGTSKAVIADAVFDGNAADAGGGIYASGTSNLDLSFADQNDAFKNNVAKPNNGGAISKFVNATVKVSSGLNDAIFGSGLKNLDDLDDFFA